MGDRVRAKRAEKWGGDCSAPFREGEAGFSANTMSPGLRRLPPYQVASWSIQPSGHNTPTSQTGQTTVRYTVVGGKRETVWKRNNTKHSKNKEQEHTGNDGQYYKVDRSKGRSDLLLRSAEDNKLADDRPWSIQPSNRGLLKTRQNIITSRHVETVTF